MKSARQKSISLRKSRSFSKLKNESTRVSFDSPQSGSGSLEKSEGQPDSTPWTALPEHFHYEIQKKSCWGAPLRPSSFETCEQMHASVLDSIVEIHSHLQLKDHTLFLAAGLLDQYSKTQLLDYLEYQLFGLVALTIACKFEENASMTALLNQQVGRFGFSPPSLTSAEAAILGASDFSLLCTSPPQLLCLLLSTRPMGKLSSSAVLYLLYLSLYDWRIQRFSVLTLLTAALKVVARLLGEEDCLKLGVELETMGLKGSLGLGGGWGGEASESRMRGDNSVKTCECLLLQKVGGGTRRGCLAVRKKFTDARFSNAAGVIQKALKLV